MYMKVRKSKILYLTILVGLIAFALVDIQQQSQYTLSFRIEETEAKEQFVANPINQKISEDEQDHFYSLLVPCD